MATMKVEIVTPRRAVYSATVDSVTLPGEIGELGALPGHLPLITTVGTGTVTVKGEDGVRRFFVHNGFAQVLPDRVRLLVDACEGADDIDVEEARKRLKALEETIDSHGIKSPEEVAELAKKLRREHARVAVAEYATSQR